MIAVERIQQNMTKDSSEMNCIPWQDAEWLCLLLTIELNVVAGDDLGEIKTPLWPRFGRREVAGGVWQCLVLILCVPFGPDQI